MGRDLTATVATLLIGDMSSGWVPGGISVGEVSADSRKFGTLVTDLFRKNVAPLIQHGRLFRSNPLR
jgi:hypothetical protein